LQSGILFGQSPIFFIPIFFIQNKREKILFLSLIIIPYSLAVIYYFTLLWGAKGTALGLLLNYFITFVVTLFLQNLL
jgi:hypothetical protein